MMNRSFGTVLVLSCSVILMAPPLRATPSLVVNGGFESPPAPGLATEADGWVCANIEVVTGAYWPAAEGEQSVDLNGITLGSVYQDLATTPGQPYRIRFAMSGNAYWYGLKTMDVAWGGLTVGSPSFDPSQHSGMGWTYFEYDVTAIDSTTRLSFISTTGATPSGGPALDDVSVRSVPEPTTLGLLALGGLALAGRRREGR